RCSCPSARMWMMKGAPGSRSDRTVCECWLKAANMSGGSRESDPTVDKVAPTGPLSADQQVTTVTTAGISAMVFLKSSPSSASPCCSGLPTGMESALSCGVVQDRAAELHHVVDLQPAQLVDGDGEGIGIESDDVGVFSRS